MARKTWIELGPSLMAGAGIIVSTLTASLAAKAGWLVMAGPLVLALAVVGADLLASRLQGRSSDPSPAALLLGVSFLVAGAIVASRDPGLVKPLLPTFGIMGWVALRPSFQRRRQPCGSR
jgi:hypothetical protein